MKKILLSTAAVALMLSVGITSAFAMHPGRGQRFVDGNGDGICDSYSSHWSGCGQNFVDNNQDGICYYYGTGDNGSGVNFVDTNQDGICDNMGTRGCGGAGRHCSR